jgi:tetratricopeptide (TPR) repeat protein
LGSRASLDNLVEGLNIGKLAMRSLLLLLLLLISLCYSIDINFLKKPLVSLSISISSISLILNNPINSLAVTNIDSNTLTPSQLVQAGMRAFTKGEIVRSVELFDDAKQKNPELDNYLWQRGLSLYYMNEFDACADQFKRDVVVNKDDTEEAIWNLACSTQSNYEKGKGDKSLEIARKNMLNVGKDRRAILNTAYNVYKGNSPEEKLVEEEGDNDDPFSISYFYSKLYQGLFKDMQNDKSSGLKLMRDALDSKYASVSNDYMVTLARNHVKLREMEE